MNDKPTEPLDSSAPDDGRVPAPTLEDAISKTASYVGSLLLALLISGISLMATESVTLSIALFLIVFRGCLALGGYDSPRADDSNQPDSNGNGD